MASSLRTTILSIVLLVTVTGCVSTPAPTVVADHISPEQQRRVFSEARYLVLIEDSLSERKIKPTPELQDQLIKLLDSEFAVSRENAAAILGIFFKSSASAASAAVRAALSKEEDPETMMYMIVALRRLPGENRDFVVRFLNKLRETKPKDYGVLLRMLPDHSNPTIGGNTKP